MMRISGLGAAAGALPSPANIKRTLMNQPARQRLSHCGCETIERPISPSPPLEERAGERRPPFQSRPILSHLRCDKPATERRNGLPSTVQHPVVLSALSGRVRRSATNATRGRQSPIPFRIQSLFLKLIPYLTYLTYLTHLTYLTPAATHTTNSNSCRCGIKPDSNARPRKRRMDSLPLSP